MEKENFEEVEGVVIREITAEKVENDEVVQEEEEQVVVEELEIEDLDYEAETQIELSEKAKKFQEKIDLLCDRVEQEASPLKRHMLIFQIKMLNSKIQREIDIQNIQAKYDYRRRLLSGRKERREEGIVDNIAELNEKIRYIKGYLNGNEEYDYESEEFIFSKEYIEKAGGIENFAEKLKQSKKETTQQAGNRIAEITQARNELNDLKEQLKLEQEKLENSDKKYTKSMKGIEQTEKALILANKVNIFSRIGNFFGTMVEEAKSYWQDRKELKEFDKQRKEQLRVVDEEYNRLIEELEEQRAAKKLEMEEQFKQEKQEQNINKSKDVAATFRSSQVVPPEEMVEEAPSQETEEPALETEQEPVEQEGEELE